MSTDYVPNSTLFPTPIVVPELGDDADAASFAVVFEPLADQLAYLNARRPGLFTAKRGSNFVTASAAYVEALTLVFDGTAPYLFGMAIRYSVPGGTVGEVRLRTSTAFATAGTAYAESDIAFIVNGLTQPNVGLQTVFVATVVTGLNLYLETKVVSGGGSVTIETNTQIFALRVG